MGQRWFVVQTAPGQEPVAESNLRNQKFDVFHPTRIVEKRHPRYYNLSSSVMQPLFPGYVLVKFDRDVDRWESINGTRGCQRILGVGEKPTPISTADVDDLMRFCDAGIFDEKIIVAARVRAGERAEINDGSFVGRVVKCLRTKRDTAEVLLSLFGGSVKTWLPISSLTPIAISNPIPA